jgi:hypothetical protein
MLARLLIALPKLRIPVEMLGALQGLLGALQRRALLLEQPPDGVVADLEPLPTSASASWRVDLHVHRRGLSGSPRVEGSTNSSNALSSPGSRSTSRLGPPPGPRTRPRGSGGASSSRTPAYTVGRDSPLIRAIRAPPPRPSALAAAPASRRRCFSVRCEAISSYSPPSTASTSTPRRYRPSTPPRQLSDKVVMRGPRTVEHDLREWSSAQRFPAFADTEEDGGSTPPAPTRPWLTSANAVYQGWLTGSLSHRPYGIDPYSGQEHFTC